MAKFKIITLAVLALMCATHASDNEHEESANASSPPELRGEVVRKKIDAKIEEIKEKIKTVEKADPSSHILEELNDILQETEEIKKLFEASHQFLEAEKYIINKQIDRIDTSIKHIEATAAVQDAVTNLSGAKK